MELLSKIGRVNLRKEFAIRFSADDLRVISFDLGIHYDALAGDTIDVKLVSLITLCERNDGLKDLLDTCQGLRPSVDWYHVACISNDLTIQQESESRDLPKHQPNDERGLLDIMESLERDFELSNMLITRVGKAIEVIGEKVAVHAKTLHELNAGEDKSNRNSIKQLLNAIASDMDGFSDQIDNDLPEFSRNFLAGVQGIGDAAEILSDFGKSKNGEIESVNSSLGQLQNGLDSAQEGILSFREAVASLPRMTSDLNRSRNRAVIVLDKLLAEMDMDRQTITRVEQKIQLLLVKANL